ncbi:Protein ABHD8 [Frankliniella fusca]|uniref:acylglycerol lipase n=1 Tax=Frankliniella fusca TaxID=407009 RepID=A0AAE1HKZ4_9NEOP|nr:Protein ABHD8 [Frankliniella fusca]
MQASTTSSAWCGNLHQAQQVATQGIQWLFGCLPCVRRHHRVHPTILESSDLEYIVVDSKKRLRVLHILPDSTNSSNTKFNCQSDSIDQCSLESSGEDYWFMRWNRPIRLNFNRNSCNCSFRRSQTKSVPDLKDPILEESQGNFNRSEIVIKSQRLDLDKKNDGCLHFYAEKLSHSILAEAISRSLEIKSGIKENLNNSFRVLNCGENSLKCCDKTCQEDVRVTIGDTNKEFGGYVNPVFLSSNDSLNLIPSEDKQNNCANELLLNGILNQEDTYMKEHQDYNANDQHILQRVTDCNKQSKDILKPNPDDNIVKKRHRKSCVIGTKAHLKKPLLLLIHGAGSSSEIWRNLISHLVHGGYECVAPDLLGHGLSSAPDSAHLYTFHAFLQDLLCIFDRFVMEGRTAVILGHGYGCSMAAAIARYRPEQVIQLILISGGGPTPLAPRTPPPVSPCLRACLEPLLMCGFKRDVVYSVCGKQMEPISPEASGVPRHIVEHIAQGHVWPEGDAAFHRRITAPTLLVHGMKDQHITLVQQCEMERTIPRSFLEVIPEAGHWAMLETPSHLSHMILCFIDWWAPPNRTQ